MNQPPDIFLGPDFSAKKQTLTDAGAAAVRIVSDFDRTITKAFRDGQPSATSMSLLYRSGLLSEEFGEYCRGLDAIYRPIELDNTLDPKVKYQKMEEWWTLCLEALLKEKLSLDLIKTIAQSPDLMWRPGAIKLFSQVMEKQLPLIIFSGGIGNVIQEYLHYNQVWSDWIQIISNFLQFDRAGIATDYSRPVLHAANKHETFFRSNEQFATHNGRHYTILLGDQLGDATVVQDFDQQHVLKIGFLNQDIEKSLPQFQRTFDVVITNDGSMDFVTELIEKLT